MRPRSAQWWMCTALAVNLSFATFIFVTFGSGVPGTSMALRTTARAAFLWFWLAYTGGALATLFGASFLPLKRLGREFGLAFAAALLVHLTLVAWLCWIGKAPGFGVFAFFGPVAALTFALALLSFGNLQTVLGPKLWQATRLIGMNVILYAFLTDFMPDPYSGALKLAEYLPYTAMAVAAPLLKLAAWAERPRETRFNWRSVIAYFQAMPRKPI